MSIKKKTDWMEFLADSDLPADEFTFTDASTYGLDGFQFDKDMGAGVEEGPGRLPETQGLSGLPDGFIQAAEEGLDLRALTELDHGADLTAMLSAEEGALPMSDAQRRAASLVNLEWLDPTQQQDPDRLPKELRPDQPPLNSVPELEEAWGVHRKTDGLRLVPNRDKNVVDYEQSIQEGPRSQVPGGRTASQEEIRDACLKATRQAHFGMPLMDIKRGMVATLGHAAVQTRAVVARLEQEHGLLGKVYIRASAFPGLRNGKWSQAIRKHCASARYVITEDEAVSTKLGLTRVASVPWQEALEHYQPRMEATGYKFASGGDPRTLLKVAFQRGPVREAPKETLKPVEKPIVATAAEARAALAAPVDAAPAMKTSEDKARAKKMRQALVRIAKWTKAGKLQREQALQLRARSEQPEVTPVGLLKEAAQMVAASGATQAYALGAGVIQTDVRMAREASALSGVQAGEILGMLRWARMQMSEGRIGDEFNQLLAVRFSEPLRKAAGDALRQVRAQHEGLSGHVYVDAQAYASAAGTTGCERGAAKHRANGLKFVLAMDRCAGCVFANQDGVCQQYNKKLVVTPPVQNIKAFQKEALRLADAPDQEITASLFNAREYDLHNAMEEVAVDPALPTKTLSSVLFGGTELECDSGV